MKPKQIQAEAAEQDGRWEEALELWYALAKMEPSASTYCSLGSVARELHRWQEAENAFLTALKQDSSSIEALECLGVLSLEREDIEAAEKLQRAEVWFSKALRFARSARTLTFLGAVRRALDDTNSARALLEEAIRKDDRYDEAYLNLASLEKVEHPQRAMELLERAIDIDPSYGKAHQQLGVLAQKSGQKEKAEYHFRRSKELSPGDTWSHLYLANLLANQGRREEAEIEYRLALAADPNNPDTRRFLTAFLQNPVTQNPVTDETYP